MAGDCAIVVHSVAAYYSHLRSYIDAQPLSVTLARYTAGEKVGAANWEGGGHPALCSLAVGAFCSDASPLPVRGNGDTSST